MELAWSALTGSLPPELGKLGSLTELYLQGNQLSGSIPPEFGDLANIEEVDLGINELSGSVPPELGSLTQLHTLLLGRNRLTSIPHGIAGMESLRRLDLGGNRLTSEGLPPGVFSGLPSLQSLGLSDNRLSELPEGMFLGLPRLSLLSLDGNPGVPFTLTLEAIRTDGEEASARSPARMAVRLAEGAPVDLRIPLSVHGGEATAEAAVLEAGSDRSAEVTVTGRAGTEVVMGPLPLLPRILPGLQLESAGSLVLFGSVSNRAPVPVRSLPWMRMREGDEPRQIPVSSYFDDPDGDALTYSATSAVSGVVSVSVANDRLTVAPLAMGSTKIVVTATDDAGLAAESSFPVSVRGVREGSYAIDLILTDRPGGVVEAAFDDAVEFWESILADTELPDVPVGPGVALGCQGVTSNVSLEVIDDLAIVADVGELDGQGRTLGWAAVCGIREESGLPLIGVLRFDSEDLEVLRESDAMEEVILHEIGHLLGFGTVWDEQGLLINPSLPDSLGTDTHFRGPFAIAAFDEAGGDIYTGGQKVPVENYAGRGSADAHWRESVLDHELMTPRLNLGVSNPLSATTVQSLADMGYTVDARLAEPFRLPGAAAAARDQEARKIEYGDDVRPGPIMVFDRDGRVVRIISN
ncbi:leishmanolysin-related zinc metalloendopeptidase [Candidatus Palauibacter sp.]|uniref:leishmanolysin-related zinc metalloendopeptidase n=1 Tax=Candidatus Palauibacter sp. TaxID=3101350 RepID=UPI003B52E90A